MIHVAGNTRSRPAKNRLRGFAAHIFCRNPRRQRVAAGHHPRGTFFFFAHRVYGIVVEQYARQTRAPEGEDCKTFIQFFSAKRARGPSSLR